MEISRGDIVIANLDPVIGGEQKGKSRPCIVVQTDTGKDFSPTTIVVPLTSAQDKEIYIFQVLVSKDKDGVRIDSIAKCEQIRTIDKRRIVDNIGKISNETMKQIEEGISLILDI